ncbi:MAG TPA: 3-deoxy-D-manno-octulosonic acid transferase [Mariprofundaceae bacterium]|nr:3-deoxy-D-manno-octulosonic acid transferase [Mariprofundaceae bacterium]
MQPEPAARSVPAVKWRQHLALDLPDARTGCLWVHACSMGEINSVAPLIRWLLARGHAIHLTVVTRTGYHQALRLFADSLTISYLPWDLPGTMRRLIRRLDPRLLLLTETEFWPGMLAACRRRGIPVIGINTRISDRSFPRYLASRALWRRWLEPVRLFLAQSELDASRLAALGIRDERIRVAGNLKFAIRPPDADAGALRRHLDASGRRPILLVASTHDDEERRLLSMLPGWRSQLPELLTVIVPRHPERFEAVAAMIAEAGLPASRWSQAAPGRHDVCLVDAMGLLSSLYTVADIVIIGGSLVPVGGHNPLEAAICGRGVITGPHVENFRDVMQQMQSAGAAVIARDDTELDAAIRRFLAHPAELRQLHERAAAFMTDKAAVLERITEALGPYLPGPGMANRDA